jgi:hypothetical protein
MLLARTTDGGRTWTDVTPASGLPLLATPYAEQALDPVNGEDAYLAVTGATQESNNSVNTTVVFATTDGGRTWTQSVPLRAVSTASQVSFADPEHGFLLFGGDGGAMGEDQVWLYRTADGGKHWSLAAASPAEPGAAVTAQQGSGRIPTECDKHALNFPTVTTGWIDSTCNAFLANALLVSHDGGSSWSDQSLPLPATTCAGGACFVTGPQFVGGVGFVTIAPWPGTPALLETRDQGADLGADSAAVRRRVPADHVLQPDTRRPGGWGKSGLVPEHLLHHRQRRPDVDAGATGNQLHQDRRQHRLHQHPGRPRLDHRREHRPNPAHVDLSDDQLRPHLARLHPAPRQLARPRSHPGLKPGSGVLCGDIHRQRHPITAIRFNV